MATNIFVGFSSSDFQFSEALMTALTAIGLRVWHEEQPSDKTTALLEECQIFLLVLSKGALLAPVLRNQALEYATLHNFHPENQLIVIQLESLASRDLWLFIRHDPQFVRVDETEAAFITRIGQEITALASTASAPDAAGAAVTAPKVASLNGSPSGKRKGKNQWRPFLAITTLVLAFVAVAAIAGWQLFLAPHTALSGTPKTSTNIGSTTVGGHVSTPTISPPPRAITTTLAEATATPHATPHTTPPATPTMPATATPMPTSVPVIVTPVVDFSRGFVNANTLQLNGGASLSGTALQITDNINSEARSAFFTTPVNITAFTCHFTFQDTNSDYSADGFTFAIQNNNASALGPAGGDLGYTGIDKSVAVKFDLFSFYQNAPNYQVSTTGIYLNGAAPDQPEIVLPQSMSFHGGDVFDVVMAYKPGSLATTITDTSNNVQFSQSYAVDIPRTVGGDSAYIGFTGATGSLSATQDILTWSYTQN